MFYRDKKNIELFPDKIDPNLDPYSISSRLKLDEDKKGHTQRMLKGGLDQSIENANDYEDREAYEWAVKTGSKIRPRFIISSVNEATWGHVADSLAMVMLNMLVEYESYSVVLEQKRQLRSKISLIGRINEAQLQEFRLKEKERLKKEEEEELIQLDVKLKRLEGIEEEVIDDNMSHNDSSHENDGGHIDINKVIKNDHGDDDKGDVTVNDNKSMNENNDYQYQSDSGNNRQDGSSLARSKDKKSKVKNKSHRRRPKKQKEMNIDNNTNSSIIDNSNDDVDDDEDGDTHHHIEIVHGTHDPVEDNSISIVHGADASSVDKQSSSSSQVSAVQQHAVISLPSIVEKNSNSSSSNNNSNTSSNNNNNNNNNNSLSRRGRGKDIRAVVGATEEKLPPI
jgi:hypothetical protein